MKPTLFVLALIVVATAAFWAGRQTAPSQPAITPVVEAVSPELKTPVVMERASKAPPKPEPQAESAPVLPRVTPAAANSKAVPDTNAPIRQAAELLVSAQTTFEQKQALWTRLKSDGTLNQVVAQLEQSATNNPTSAEYPAVLGQAYLQQITMSKNPRDHALLGLKADQSFDAALELDPANWEAGFFKATAMTYWPSEMNKGPEIIQRFTDLIERQETQPSEPQFANSYLLLGEYYKKTGRTDYAGQVWSRGAALFPGNPSLQKKTASAR